MRDEVISDEEETSRLLEGNAASESAGFPWQDIRNVLVIAILCLSALLGILVFLVSWGCNFVANPQKFVQNPHPNPTNPPSPQPTRNPTSSLMDAPSLVPIVSQTPSEEKNSSMKSASGYYYRIRSSVLPLRAREIDPNYNFSFIHVPKCAGTSWIHLLKELFPGRSEQVCPEFEAGAEHSVWYQRKKVCTNANYHFISLRSPRHHLWSQFTECKHASWGRRVTKGTTFPRSGGTPEDDEVDFGRWLSHFLPLDKNHEDKYNCYHPGNFQSRQLTSTKKGCHSITALPTETRYLPNTTHGLEVLESLDYVALTEFFHESKCLFYYRLNMTKNSTVPQQAIQYLNDNCHCRTGRRLQHITHHTLGHRKELWGLPSDSLEKINNLTIADQIVYVGAIEMLMVEIAWVERRLGRRVLCQERLSMLEPELNYLKWDIDGDNNNLNVTKLYERAKRQSK